jgi:ornithine carbamoyltransferase
MKRFIDLADFSREEVLALLKLAQRLERRPEPRVLVCGPVGGGVL